MNQTSCRVYSIKNNNGMKRYLLGTIICLLAGLLQAQPVVPPQNAKKVQVAILFDTSNSMDGLIDQAKSRIWSIVNEVSTLTYSGQSPDIQFALYEYGNDGLSKSGNYIRQVLALTNDLDVISQKLFGLRTNGGSEYCGAVIDQSLSELNWSPNPTDLKMIYIAGNESFEQGPVPYKEACRRAVGKDVYVNTIFCGDYNQGVRLKWQDGANCSKGDYFNIDSNKEVVHIDTPYDQEIGRFNDSLNKTYYGYGRKGNDKKRMQMSEDMNASGQSQSVATERAIAKSKKAAYKNASWDLLDAVEEGKDINEIEEEALPAEFKGKTAEEKKELIEATKKDRERFQKRIAELGSKRQKFIDTEMKKRADAGEDLDDFGSSVNKSILEKAVEIGFEREDQNP